jgi:Sulfotransferase domain
LNHETLSLSSRILHITKKNRTISNAIAKVQDFDVVAGGSCNANLVLENANINLYCLDFENQQAIFVETPEALDLFDAPFLYQAQYENAQRLIAVPIEILHGLAEQIQIQRSSQVFLYSVGRCGSTLLSRVFMEVPNAKRLSEPDVLSQLVALKNPDPNLNDELVKLIKSCLTILCKPTGSKYPEFIVIKFRSFGIELADLIESIFPQAKSIFLYRNAEDVVKSSVAAFAEMSEAIRAISQNIDTYSRFVPLLKEYESIIDFDDPSCADIYTTMWLSVMQRYLQIHGDGIFMKSIKYETLIENPQSTVAELFQYCGIPESEVVLACRVLQEDSQSGSNLSRDKISRQYHFIDDDAIKERVRHILSCHPTIKTSDFLVPSGC